MYSNKEKLFYEPKVCFLAVDSSVDFQTLALSGPYNQKGYSSREASHFAVK
jgi:hypothetical protein